MGDDLRTLLAWLRAYLAAHPETGTLELIEAAEAMAAAPSCRWPACLSEAEQQQLADDTGRAMLGEDTPLLPDPRPGCGCVDRGMELTREELQALVDGQGQEPYWASDKLAFVREMCDQRDAASVPITTADVRNWLAYTGCGGVLVLPEETVASLATPEATALSTQATGDGEPDDGSGFRCPVCSGPTTYQAFSGGREWCCESCEETGEYPADQTPVRAVLLRTEDGRAELRRQMREHLDGLRKERP